MTGMEEQGGRLFGQGGARVRAILSRALDYVTFRSSDWDHHAWRQTIIVGCVFVSSIGVIATVSDWWWHGLGHPWKAALWALPAALLVAITSEKRILAGVVLGLFAVYGVRGLLLLRDPFGFWVVGVSVLLIFLLVITVPRAGGS